MRTNPTNGLAVSLDVLCLYGRAVQPIAQRRGKSFLPSMMRRLLGFPTHDTIGLATSVRTALAQAIITAAGANAKLKLYNGTRPATGGTAAGTLLATLTFGTVIGVASAGLLDFDEASVTQNNATHVNGTPTWLRITTSADVFVADFSIPADASFSGTVVANTNVTMNASTITMPNA